MPVTLPAKTVLHIVAACIEDRARTLERRADDNPRGGQSKAGARRRTAAQLRGDQLAKVRHLEATATGEVDATIAALLVAWAQGWGQAAGEMECYLESIAHPQHAALCEVSGSDVAAACDLLLS
jgi:hypothetical protein